MASVAAPVVDLRYYATLEIKPSATREEIKKSYRRLALLWHPDKRQPSDLQATQKFQKINNAHEILSDETARAKYDQSIHSRLRQIESISLNSTASLTVYRQKQQVPTTASAAYSRCIERIEKELAALKDERSRLVLEFNRPATGPGTTGHQGYCAPSPTSTAGPSTTHFKRAPRNSRREKREALKREWEEMRATRRREREEWWVRQEEEWRTQRERQRKEEEEQGRQREQRFRQREERLRQEEERRQQRERRRQQRERQREQEAMRRRRKREA
ncbi:hypothetical protein QBC41DRAFT_386385 [Cercophora samala]|uniref:J domain-containing protein n=1 Tax=Cercophora samala TaxID=330535 RepID=A0AA39ZHV1_9PEZI|nr:hypothetical protein QBC41DRAFT_386385 [Cercophora samala]